MVMARGVERGREGRVGWVRWMVGVDGWMDGMDGEVR